MTTKQILNSSESVEWYTPEKYIEAVRAVLGDIELDPASCVEAQETIKAQRYCGSVQNTFIDGLSMPWLAQTVFLNPPYGLHHSTGRSAAAFWTDRLLTHYRDGLVGSAILLVNNTPSERWFAPLKYFPICETDHRIRFDYPKLRRLSLKELRRDVSLRKQLIKKQCRVWLNGAWLHELTGGDRWQDCATMVSENALSLPIGEAFRFVMRTPLREGIAFDLIDKPTQPTKGQAFVLLPDDPDFRSGIAGSRITPGDAWKTLPQIVEFMAHFSNFGFIYLPDGIALQMRELHQRNRARASDLVKQTRKAAA